MNGAIGAAYASATENWKPNNELAELFSNYVHIKLNWMCPTIANKLITKVDWLLNPHPMPYKEYLFTDHQYHWISHSSPLFHTFHINIFFWQLDWFLFGLFAVSLLFALFVFPVRWIFKQMEMADYCHFIFRMFFFNS